MRNPYLYFRAGSGGAQGEFGFSNTPSGVSSTHGFSLTSSAFGFSFPDPDLIPNHRIWLDNGVMTFRSGAHQATLPELMGSVDTSNFVTLDGDQTIAGHKTFSDSMGIVARGITATEDGVTA